MLFERKLIYFPDRDVVLTPDRLGLRFEEAVVEAEDGVRIHGWFLPVEGSTWTVLVCHGNAGNVSHRLDRTRLMQARLGTDVFLFDYRGYGRSEGAPDEEGTYRDGHAALRHLTKALGVSRDRLILFGESLGAAVALELALQGPACALVIESAFTSVADMAPLVLPIPGIAAWVRTRYDNLAKIPLLALPLLVLHGESDTIVPMEQGRRLFDAAPEPKRFFAIPGAGHNDTYLMGGEAYWREWREFLGVLGQARLGR